MLLYIRGPDTYQNLALRRGYKVLRYSTRYFRAAITLVLVPALSFAFAVASAQSMPSAAALKAWLGAREIQASVEPLTAASSSGMAHGSMGMGHPNSASASAQTFDRPLLLTSAGNRVEAFTNPLTAPPVLTDTNITLEAREADIQILPGAATQMWTYDGTFPGPTI